MKEEGTDLASRFRESLAECGVAPDERLLVALSGGRDSVVLLHLLRFAGGREADSVTAAHLDHARRRRSWGDSAWAAGLCAAWGVPLRAERASPPPRGETDARRVRYAFLRRAAEWSDARWIVTAHHADDQAETVLFRALRGTGPAGLAGIAPRRGQLVRPLLPFWRTELREYARAAGLRWRADASNRSLRPARNRLRREILPRLERTFAPAARRSLVRLATVAREERAAWEAASVRLAAEAVRTEQSYLLLHRQRIRGWGAPLAARVLRDVLERCGTRLGRAGTRRMIQFITDAPSGRVLDLPGGARLHSEPEWVRVATEQMIALPDVPLGLPAAEPAGEGGARIGGRRVRAEWRRVRAAGDVHPADGAELALEGLPFPLEIRGRRVGDRIRLAGGSKALKKLLIERQLPRTVRSSIPLLAVADQVFWARGVAVAADRRANPGSCALLVRVFDV